MARSFEHLPLSEKELSFEDEGRHYLLIFVVFSQK